jgi:uncharacterized protein (TIGR02270 family)
MPAKRGLFLPDVLQEHFEELQFLWRQRQRAVRSPAYTLRALADLDERLAAHADGLVIGGRRSLPIVRTGLGAKKSEVLFAAAYPLVAMGKEKITRRVFEMFLKAEGARLDGFRELLCHCAVSPIRSQLQQALTSSPDAVAAAIVEILASHSLLDFTTTQFERFLKHEKPAIRQAGWRAVSRSVAVRPEVYDGGLRDADPSVRDEALQAAAWGRQSSILEHSRKAAVKPTPQTSHALMMLAILGKPEDLYRLQAIGQAVELGPQRFRILGAFGNPNVVEILLQGMTSKDPLTAAAAGAAFTKITGVNVTSNERAKVPPADGKEPTEFEKEFLEEVALPNLEKARSHWQKVKSQLQKGTRWCRGLDLTQGGSREEWNQLDVESRWEAHLRGKFIGLWKGNPFELEKFPQVYTYTPPKK